MKIADKGARIGNFIADSAIVFLLIILQTLLLGIILPEDTLPIFDIYPFVFYFLYYFTFENFLGKTPGKYLTKTMVVNHSGEKPTVKALLMRTIARLIPYDYISYIFGQGLHDTISNTFVVNSRS